MVLFIYIVIPYSSAYFYYVLTGCDMTMGATTPSYFGGSLLGQTYILRKEELLKLQKNIQLFNLKYLASFT